MFFGALVVLLFVLEFKSGVAPAKQTKESEVRELSGKESGMSSGTPFCL